MELGQGTEKCQSGGVLNQGIKTFEQTSFPFVSHAEVFTALPLPLVEAGPVTAGTQSPADAGLGLWRPILAGTLFLSLIMPSPPPPP